MNKKILMACLIGFMSFFASTSNAQISVNFNVGSQPLWGPVGYDQANYYYMPGIDTYYSVPTRQYVYLQNDKWQFSNALPSRYSGYNLYNGYKVVMNSPRPYLSYNTHKVKYAKYKNYKAKQGTIKYSTNPKYFVVKGHPKHAYKGSSSKGIASSKKSTVSRNYVKTSAKVSHSGQSKASSGKGNNESKGGAKGGGKGKH